MAAMVTCKCKTCEKSFDARVADRNRGWARFCSKSCKAVKQVQRGGYNPNNHLGSGVSRETYMHYAREYGGTPKFNRRGDYIGFTPSPFDNTQNQNHGEQP